MDLQEIVWHHEHVGFYVKVKDARALLAEIERLRARLERYQQTFEGWKVAKECDDGSLILESHTGERRHVWQGCEEKAQAEK